MAQVRLSRPVQKVAVAAVELERITIDLRARWVHVQWLLDDGTADSIVYRTPPEPGKPSGARIINQIITGQLTSKSTNLIEGLLAQLQADGVIGAGTVEGDVLVPESDVAVDSMSQKPQKKIGWMAGLAEKFGLS
jgi:hypothetical protein